MKRINVGCGAHNIIERAISSGNHCWRITIESLSAAHFAVGIVRQGRQVKGVSYREASFYGLDTYRGGWCWAAGKNVGECCDVDFREGDSVELFFDVDNGELTIVPVGKGRRFVWEGLLRGKAWFLHCFVGGDASLLVEVLDPSSHWVSKPDLDSIKVVPGTCACVLARKRCRSMRCA